MPHPADIPTDSKAVATLVWDAMKTCYDPEIPVNIVELGLVYENKVEPVDGGYKVDVKFTLTAPGPYVIRVSATNLSTAGSYVIWVPC